MHMFLKVEHPFNELTLIVMILNINCIAKLLLWTRATWHIKQFLFNENIWIIINKGE